MPSIGQAAYYGLVTAWGAAFYQLYVKDFLSDTIGVGRTIQAIEEFPYSCRRVVHPRLEGCEDLWLDDVGRTLYAACAGTEGRIAWCPALANLNATGRRPGGSELIALDIDNPGTDGLYNLRAIKPTAYTGATGIAEDISLDLLGFDAKAIDGDTIQFYLINERPQIGAFNNIIDATVLGANSTIEVFEMRRGEEVMRHLRTIVSPAIITPNRLAILGDGNFVLTNDHATKTGWRRELDPYIGGGNVVYCHLGGTCHNAFSGDEADASIPRPAKIQPRYKDYLDLAFAQLPKPKLRFPNGLTRGFDGLIYVPSAVDGSISVLAVMPDKKLRLVETIRTGMPLDNIAPDATGDLYIAGFPDLLRSQKAMQDPRNLDAPVTLLRIRKTVDAGPEGVRSVDYRVEKVIEDKEGKVLSGSTTVRRDAKTGRLFVGGATSPFLVVCEPR